ncbi:hypothetical protein GCM10023144_46470 [Pigmentiphaga soli]|uniref:CcoQ/FixQ family Cbb3-type cytochrome c oxidase assembly chaperone n=2 Tax=Pigmentiphaga soli TaxID=1007095 RepID=A0ABP8HS46_9BURK
MWLLLLEALLALAVFVLIVAWTMWPKRRDLTRKGDGTQAPAGGRQAPGDPDQ